MRKSIVEKAEIVREYGQFAGTPNVGGVSYDGRHVWFAAGDNLRAFDPVSGEAVRVIDVAALHRPLLGDEPRLFFMHFWANDDAIQLARTLKVALSKTNSAKPT